MSHLQTIQHPARLGDTIVYIFIKTLFLLICLIYKLYNIPRDLAIHSLLSIETLSGRKHHISIDKRMHCETSVAKKGRIQQW